MEENNIFAIRLKEARIKKNISQAELSRITGIAPATLSSYEKGKSPTIDKAIKIADALNVSLDWLTGKEPEFPIKKREDMFRLILTAIMLIITEGFASVYKDSEWGTFRGLDFDEYAGDCFSEFIDEFEKISAARELLPSEMAQTLDNALIEKYVKLLIDIDESKKELEEILGNDEDPF